MGTSVLDDLGQEVTGIVTPVSICMFITVLLVRLLNPDGVSNPNAVAMAQAFYKEQEGDSAGTKIEGALLNALIFVVFVGALTFVLFLLFKYGCEKVIYYYMAFAGFSIFFLLTGIVALQLVQLTGVPLDAISFLFILYNFSIVGVVTLFAWPAPMLLKQGYLIITGVIVAFVFSGIPEWTTWALLLMMALYDIVAVLTPGGPLKLLVELAIERDADIPALVYEARPTSHRPVQRRSAGERMQRSVQPQVAEAGSENEMVDLSSGSSNSQGEADALLENAPLLQEIQAGTLQNVASSEGGRTAIAGGMGFLVTLDREDPAEEASGGLDGGPGLSQGADGAGAFQTTNGNTEELVDMAEDAPLMPQSQANASHADEHHAPAEEAMRRRQIGDLQSHAEDQYGLPDAIKLGLGDFIFYSMLVARAAMYDMLTVFASYLAIIAGLGATLLLLALYRKALPALPISIALGVAFYFLARALLEPFVLPLSMHLLYY